jgi:hypothetical protein
VKPVTSKNWSVGHTRSIIIDIAEKYPLLKKDYDLFYDARNYNTHIAIQVLTTRPLPKKVLVLQPEDNYIGLVLYEFGFRITVACTKGLMPSGNDFTIIEPRPRIFDHNQTYDMVLLLGCLERIALEPDDLLAKIKTVLRPRGTLLIADRNIMRSAARLRRLLKKTQKPILKTTDIETEKSSIFVADICRGYSLKDVKTLIEKSGYRIDRSLHCVGKVPYEMVSMSFIYFLGRVANYMIMKAIPPLRDTFLIRAKNY